MLDLQEEQGGFPHVATEPIQARLDATDTVAKDANVRKREIRYVAGFKREPSIAVSLVGRCTRYLTHS